MTAVVLLLPYFLCIFAADAHGGHHSHKQQKASLSCPEGAVASLHEPNMCVWVRPAVMSCPNGGVLELDGATCVQTIVVPPRLQCPVNNADSTTSLDRDGMCQQIRAVDAQMRCSRGSKAAHTCVDQLNPMEVCPSGMTVMTVEEPQDTFAAITDNIAHWFSSFLKGKQKSKPITRRVCYGTTMEVEPPRLQCTEEGADTSDIYLDKTNTLCVQKLPGSEVCRPQEKNGIVVHGNMVDRITQIENELEYHVNNCVYESVQTTIAEAVCQAGTKRNVIEADYNSHNHVNTMTSVCMLTERAPFFYVCPEGYAMVESTGNCLRKIQKAAEWKCYNEEMLLVGEECNYAVRSDPELICPKGTFLLHRKCIKKHIVRPRMYCDSGRLLTGPDGTDRCVKTTKLKLVDHFHI
eukprot:Filipodium_phascolosomae@DN1629_c0_g1_i1.p1